MFQVWIRIDDIESATHDSVAMTVATMSKTMVSSVMLAGQIAGQNFLIGPTKKCFWFMTFESFTV
jgi:hypothetical protein